MENSKLYSILALTGTTPFVACALLPLIGIDTLPVLGALDFLASTYGLAIICFLAGAHWGIYLYGQSRTPFNLFVSSNVVLLAVWFAFIGANLAWSIAVQIIAFQISLVHRLSIESGRDNLCQVLANPFRRNVDCDRFPAQLFCFSSDECCRHRCRSFRPGCRP